MSKYATIVLMLLLACGNIRADSVETEANLGYYENLSVIAFVSMLDILNAIDECSGRERYAREVAFIMYVYYLDTRKGGRPVSRKVDRAVQRVYQIGFAELKYVNTYNPFNDPVGWLESDKPGIKISDKRPSLSKEEYVEFVQEFFEFLHETTLPTEHYGN